MKVKKIKTPARKISGRAPVGKKVVSTGSTKKTVKDRYVWNEKKLKYIDTKLQ